MHRKYPLTRLQLSHSFFLWIWAQGWDQETGLAVWRVWRNGVKTECWLCGCLRPFFLLNSTKFLFPEYLLLLGAILMGRSVRCILRSYLRNLSHSWWTSGGSYLLEELALLLICCCSTAREEVFWVGSGVIVRVLGRSTSGSNFLSSKWAPSLSELVASIFQNWKIFPPACGKTLYNYDSNLHLAGAGWSWALLKFLGQFRWDWIHRPYFFTHLSCRSQQFSVYEQSCVC